MRTREEADMNTKNELEQVRKERDYLAEILTEHCRAQEPGTYEADGEYCRAFKAKCPFPYRECQDITPEMWVEKAM